MRNPPFLAPTHAGAAHTSASPPNAPRKAGLRAGIQSGARDRLVALDPGSQPGFRRACVREANASVRSEGGDAARRMRGASSRCLRLGARAGEIDCVVADVTRWRPERTFALWHDRAVLHFLIEAEDQAAYADVLRGAVAPEGWVVIGGFAPGGPAKCSGLPVVQHDAASLGLLLGEAFRLLETHGETHRTPSGAEQAFRYHVFQRRSG